MTESEMIAKYGHVTVGDVLRLYDGPLAQPCPPELELFLACAIAWRDLRDAKRKLAHLLLERAQ